MKKEMEEKQRKEGLEEIKQQPGQTTDLKKEEKRRKKKEKKVTDIIEERKNKRNASETAKARNGMNQWNETKWVQEPTEWEQGEIVFM